MTLITRAPKFCESFVASTTTTPGPSGQTYRLGQDAVTQLEAQGFTGWWKYVVAPSGDRPVKISANYNANVVDGWNTSGNIGLSGVTEFIGTQVPTSLSKMLSDLSSLIQSCVDDGVTAPSTYAIKECRTFLFGLWARFTRVNLEFPRGCITTEDDGRIRIEWKGKNGSVYLVKSENAVPVQGPSYIYFSKGNEFRIEQPANIGRVFTRLSELL